MNILLTDSCNRRCAYCFAQGKLNKKPAFMSMTNLRRAIAFLKRSGEKRIGIIGGEPTLHPEFNRIVSKLLNDGFEVHLFTNGLMRPDTVEFLRKSSAKKITLLLNINDPKSYSKEEWVRISRTLQALNKIAMLGFTVYDLKCSPDFMLELVKRYDLVKKIRLGIAAPVAGADNRYLPLNQHKKVVKKLVKFAEECSTDDVSCVFDCGFTLCDFTPGQFGRLYYAGAKVMMQCAPVIDVSPDLSVWRCFAISMHSNKKLTDFTNLGQIRDFYDKRFRLFKMTGNNKECLHCIHLRRGLCDGGCLGHTLKQFDLKAALS